MFDAMQRKKPVRVRPAAVAGTFYPLDPTALCNQIAGFLREASGVGPIPKGLIVPHAGYQYSGPVAASGYALLKLIRHRVRHVVLLGPSHHMPFYGLAATSNDAFATPLGVNSIDQPSVETSLALPHVQLLDQAHHYEHSLEVQLPFLQVTLDDFSLVPLAIGQADTSTVANVIDALWDADKTLLVVSSDLSHYRDYRAARALDADTSNLIEQLQWQQLSGERACGYGGIRGLLKVAQQRNLRVKTLDLRNSGDTSGTKNQVVGYGSYVVY